MSSDETSVSPLSAIPLDLKIRELKIQVTYVHTLYNYSTVMGQA